jgi:hypothetical protein
MKEGSIRVISAMQGAAAKLPDELLASGDGMMTFPESKSFSLQRNFAKDIC